VSGKLSGLLRLVQMYQAAEARALEDETADGADGGAAEALAAVAARAASRWVREIGSWDGTGASTSKLEAFLNGLRRQIKHALDGLGPRASQALLDGLASAAALGARHAVAFGAKAAGRVLQNPGVALTLDLLDLADSLTDDVGKQVKVAMKILTPRMVRRLGGLRGVLAGIGAARRAVNLVKSRVAWAINRAINAAAAVVAGTLNLGLLWIAELDACPTCRAYSGRYAAPGADFPGGISLDPRQRAYFPAPIPGPPRHPNCRCRTVPWSRSWGNDLPAHLKAAARAPAAA
jgi:hypothetical protein